MSYLFDTDILSNLVKRVPSPTLLRRLAHLAPESQFTSTITVGEMIYGAHKSDRPEHFIALLQTQILPNVEVLSFGNRSGG